MNDLTTLDMLLRIFIALVCGCAIGSERQIHHRTAGLRTNALVALGACAFTIFDLMNHLQYGSELRVSAQVASGIGFLCGGVIIKEGFNIRGLTTAATLWCAASSGVLAGMGYLLEAAIISILVMFINIFLRPIVLMLDSTASEGTEYLIKVSCDSGKEEKVKLIILKYLEAKKLTLKDLRINKSFSKKGDTHIETVITSNKNKVIEDISHKIAENSDINGITWDIIQH